ncbi:hypothetical protein L916_15020 [Phytophthora nicotianae]|uniref:Uncharacterized protein n=1 Tax=Phytophthora nicotianae TaxID=4792 RepID=W2IGC6_PHYNI|nr:hypothetical protein L916_15020 [Phytophthora nicotianae]
MVPPPATQALSTNVQMPTVTDAPVWANTPAVGSPGTVAPFAQTEMNQGPAFDTATNSPNSFSSNNENQATSCPLSGQDQMQSMMAAPAFSFGRDKK